MGQMQNVNDLDEIQHPGLLIGAKGIDRSDGLKMADLLNKISSSIMEIYNRSVVVTCFSKSCYTSGPIDASHASFGNKVLWGTYADNLAGAAVVFDPDLLSAYSGPFRSLIPV